MDPAFLSNMSWAMAEVYGSVTDQILVNLAHYFPYVQETGHTGSFYYQVAMLAKIGQVHKETVNIIMRNLGSADTALRTVLEATIMNAIKKEEPKLYKAAQQGLLNGPGNVPPVVDPSLMQAFQTYYRQSADKLNLVNTVMLESTENAYRNTITDVTARMQKIERTQAILNESAGGTIIGVKSWNQMMHDAVQKMVSNGLTGFVDHGGHQWSPEAYVAMDIRTTVFNTARAAIWERSEEYGEDLYQVSSHNGARPLCYPWQGKVISRTDNVRTVYDFDGNPIQVIAQSSTSYGQPAGLFGINCRHYPMVFISGVSSLRGDPQSEAENEKTYQESQEQRALERKLRREKLDLNVMKAQGADKEAIKAQKDRVDEASNAIEEFCDRTGRARRRNREYAPINASFPDPATYGPSPNTVKQQIQQHFKDEAKPLQSMTPVDPYKNLRQVTEPQSTQGTAPVVPVAPTPTPIPAPAQAKPEFKTYFVKTGLPMSGIETRELTKWDHTPTTEEIIQSLSGGDMTKGSCMSLALAYAGNRGGYKVLDFRGGESQDEFSYAGNALLTACGAQCWEEWHTSDISAVHALYTHMETGKEYVLTTGRHAAIIRQTQEKGLEYLELQSRYPNKNGWHSLNDTELKNRFKAKKTHTRYGNKIKEQSVLAEVETLKDNLEILEALRYINTAEDKQKKGVRGSVK